MKITILSLHLGIGDVEKYVITLANILSEQHDVEVISTFKDEDYYSRSISTNITVKYLLDKNTGNLEMMDELNKIAIMNCDSDIIISNGIYHNKMVKKYTKESVIKISTEHCHHNGNNEYVEELIDSLDGFDCFLPISRELANFYSKKLARSKTRVMYIPFCISSPLYFQQPAFDKPVYINVSKFSTEKAIDELILIFKKIVKYQPDALLHLVGDGAEMSKIKDLINQYDLDSNVIIHGFVDEETLNKLYCESCLYLMTSYTESFGFVLLEAMACGLPCIAFDSAQGANQIINDGANGFLIPERNREIYVDKVLELSKDKSQLMLMSRYARQSLMEYSYQTTKEQWLDLIKKL